MHLISKFSLSRLSLLPIALIFFMACTPGEKPELQITKLNPEKAAREADSIRQTITPDVAEGFKLDLWASERLLEDPIGLDIDNQGRAFVTVTNRSTDSEFDIRGHRDWMIKSISWTTVEDRIQFLKEEFATKNSEKNNWLTDFNNDSIHDWHDLTVQKEEIHRLEDQSGDGVADFGQLFIRDFHEPETDVAGAVLEHNGDVFLGVAPDVWRLKDNNNDGMADEKTSISHGYAVHIGFSGHGMSGLTRGPDGRIYWSIGDIGSNITGPDGKKWKNPNKGSIFRSNPDGSDFEVFATGVRNTHEFTFDKFGNLIAADNDGDHAGETERLVYLFDGSESGWRANWQYGKYVDPKNNEYKVWMDENYFKPRHEGQTAHIVPPIASYHSGPAGMAYNPGTALSEKWKDHFFVAEFVGSPRSAIHAFTLEQDGASFNLATDQKILSGVLPVGMDFGPDGALYFADWMEGWGTKNKGRIWKMDTPGAANMEQREETKRLLAENFTDRSEDELVPLLHHPDMRVREKAQFELADRKASEKLLTAAQQTEHRLARIHGLWGIWQLARQDMAEADKLTGFLQDNDPEIRAQAAKIIGDIRYKEAADKLIPLLEDEEARPRFFAAQALGQIGHEPAIQPILNMLEANNDEDAYLRYAGALALARIGNPEPIVALHNHESRALRMAAVVALKKMKHPGVAHFLDDKDEYIATDAARAINDDALIKDALPDLGKALTSTQYTNEAFIRRAINANVQVGNQAAANRLATYAAKNNAPEALRAEAINALGVWHDPSILDRVTGRHRGTQPNDTAVARNELSPVIESLLTLNPIPVKIAAAEAVSNLKLDNAYSVLYQRLQNDPAHEVRVAALKALNKVNYKNAVQTATNDPHKTVRMQALSMIPGLSLPADQKVELLASYLNSGSVEEQQSALQALGAMQNEAANQVLGRQMAQLADGTLRKEIRLDLLNAIETSNDPALQEKLQAYQQAKPEGDRVASYQETLFGGDAGEGRRIFYRNDAAQCERCHAIQGRGGDVGPDLTNIGSQLTREQLLEALVEPGARIAPGFGTVTVTLKDDSTVRGIIQEEDNNTLVLQSGDGEIRELSKENIKNRQNAPSSMPPMGSILDKNEIRDMVEFLASLQE